MRTLLFIVTIAATIVIIAILNTASKEPMTNKEFIEGANGLIGQATTLLQRTGLTPQIKSDIRNAIDRLQLAVRRDPPDMSELNISKQNLINLINLVKSGDTSGVSKIVGKWCESNAEVTFTMGRDINGLSEIRGSWTQTNNDGTTNQGSINSGYFVPQNFVLIIYYSVSGIDGKATFQLSSDGTRLDGTWEQNGESGPWNLTRCTDRTAEQGDPVSTSGYYDQKR